MLTPDGALGGVAIVPESAYGTTPGSPSWGWFNFIDCNYGLVKRLITPQWATYAAPTNREYTVPYGMGELKMALSLTDTVVGNLLACGSTKTGDVYTFGDGEEPDSASFSLLQNYGGGDAVEANYLQQISAGVKPTGYTFEISKDGNSILTVPMIGQKPVVSSAGASVTPAPPAESNIIMPSDFATVTYGGSSTPFRLQGATLSVSLPKTAGERFGLGSTSIGEPVSNGRPAVNFSLQVDLDGATGNDTIAMLADWYSGTSLGTITIGDFTLNGCYLEGEIPPQQQGFIQFALTGLASSLGVETS